VIRKSLDSQWRTEKREEFWVIAVLPEYEGRGIGSKLLNLAENWLWEIGWKEIWLWTSPDSRLRAYSFYKKHGWVDAEVRRNRRILEKFNLPSKADCAEESHHFRARPNSSNIRATLGLGKTEAEKSKNGSRGQ
jgi:N-acetylglutamate synthase-like GNAT family acetyltransferase